MPGSIEKRGENSFRLVVSGGTGGDGKRKKYSKTIKVEGKTEAERKKKAEKELAKFIAEIENNSFIEPSKLTLNDFIEKWFKEYANKNLAPKTLFRYKEMINSRIIPALGHLKIDKIKPLHLLEFYNNLQENGIRNDGKPGGLSPQTIKHHHRLIHAILETAVKWQVINSNPADNVTPPKIPRIEAKYYDEKEVIQLIAALDTLDKKDMKYRVAIMITILGGLRLGELMGLKWEHINFKNSTIEISQSNQYLPKEGIFTKDPKNETSKRIISMPEPILNLISKYEIHQKEQKLNCGDKWIDTGFLFTQWNGLPMHPLTISKWFPNFLVKRGLRKITFHQLRHTSATILINAGVNIKAVSARLGHSNTATTLNIYSHSLKSADKNAADKMGELIFKETISDKKIE